MIKVEEKINLGGETGKCPYCNSENVEYGSSGPSDGLYYYESDCYECKNTWREYYILKFDGNYGDNLKNKESK